MTKGERTAKLSVLREPNRFDPALDLHRDGYEVRCPHCGREYFLLIPPLVTSGRQVIVPPRLVNCSFCGCWGCKLTPTILVIGGG